jgi:CheY-like chemotaxis protein
VMDGIAMLKKLRQDQWGAAVPVLLWTNLNDTEYMADQQEYNAVDYILKSNWTPEQVMDRIRLRLGLNNS